MKNKYRLTIWSLLLLLLLFPSEKLSAEQILFRHNDEIKATINEINTDFEGKSATLKSKNKVYVTGHFKKKDDKLAAFKMEVYFLNQNKDLIGLCEKQVKLDNKSDTFFYCPVMEKDLKNNAKLEDVYYYKISYRILNNNNTLYPYVINKYDVNIIVNENNTYHIKENIKAYFNEPRHGIFRTIPLKNEVVRLDGTSHINRARVNNIYVNNEFKVTSENGKKKIKIGTAGKRITGEEKYFIRYDYNIGNDPNKNYDEFYFNIIGNEWDTSIDNVSFKISMPKEFDKDKIGFSAGKKGSTDSSNIHYKVSGNTIYGTYEGRLNPNDALTIRLELPEGYFTKQKINYKEYLIYLIPIIFLGLSIFFWYQYGRDDKVIEVVNFYPPKGFNSLEVGYMYKGKADNEDVTSLLIYLANKGYLKITEFEEQALFFKVKDFKITKLKDYDGDDANERLFFNGLFAKSTPKKDETDGHLIYEVTSSDLYDSFYVTLGKILGNINNRDNKDKIFERKASNLTIPVILMIILTFCLITINPVMNYSGDENLIFALLFPLIGFSVIIASLVGLFNTRGKNTKSAKIVTVVFSLIWGLGFGGYPFVTMVLPAIMAAPLYLYGYILGIICIVGMFICLEYLPKRTTYGNKMLGEVTGFKNFLETAEKEKLEALVEEDPEYFYNILPYTYVLGVSDKWIKKFETISMQAPTWYDSPNAFNVSSFNSFMDRTMTSASSAMSSSPSSSSGSSGGGSSGGGSGGGGGGSW